MVERSETLAFAPGALVFPGGRVDPADRALSLALGIDDLGARIAAIRETIEECGVTVGLHPAPSPDRSRKIQRALLDGADFGSLISRFQLEVRGGVMTPFARWIPGHEVSRRFDTHFFIAAADCASTPHVGGSECVSARWTSAAAALQADREGTAKLIYPTRKNLERLAQFASFEEMIEDARRHPVTPVIADLTLIDGEPFVTIPEGMGYPVTRDPLADVWRG